MLVLVPKVSISDQVTVRYEGDTHWSRNRISLVIYTQTETNLVQNSKQTNTMCIKAIDSISEEVWNDCTGFTSPVSLAIYLVNPCATPCPNRRQASSLVMLPVAWKSKPRNKARVAVKPFLTLGATSRKNSFSFESHYIYIYTKSKGVQKVFVPPKGNKKTRVFTKILGDSEWMASPHTHHRYLALSSQNLQSGCIQPTTPFRKLRWDPNMVVWKIIFNSIGWSLGFSWIKPPLKTNQRFFSGPKCSTKELLALLKKVTLWQAPGVALSFIHSIESIFGRTELCSDKGPQSLRGHM